MNENGDNGIQIRMTRQQARDFADSLTDDTFRSDLEQDPQKVLADYGIQVPSRFVPKGVRLPEKSDVEDAIQQIPGGYPLRGEADAWFFYPILHLIFALAFLEEVEELEELDE